jgi:small conductance mechanosensitive channel
MNEQPPPASGEPKQGRTPPKQGRTPPKMFETRSASWREAGLAHEIDPARVRAARRKLGALVLLFAGVIVVFAERHLLLGVGGPACPAGTRGCVPPHSDTPVRVVAVLLLIILGTALAREGGRALGPLLFRRMEPATAGTVGFLVRLLTVVVVILVALVIAGLNGKEALAYGGAFTAILSVIVGLAAQQTLGNLFAGTVLLTARPFRVGERVRLQGGPLSGQLEGIVSSLGLLYTTFAVGGDLVMIPNSVVLAVAIRPLRSPEAVTLRVRLPGRIVPAAIERRLEGELKVPLRGPIEVRVEELDREGALVQVGATPRRSSEARKLAAELSRLLAGLAAANAKGELVVEPVAEE